MLIVDLIIYELVGTLHKALFWNKSGSDIKLIWNNSLLPNFKINQAIWSYKRLFYLIYDQRGEILNNIKGVVNVIKQDTFDYTENLKTIKPSNIVHGDDWKEGVKRYNRESFKTMQEWNGQVIDIPY